MEPSKLYQSLSQDNKGEDVPYHKKVLADILRPRTAEEKGKEDLLVIQPTTANPTGLPSIPDDVLNVIAQHADWSTTLTLLAARPGNHSLVRGLYEGNSSFWEGRLGAQTGFGPLLRENPETGHVSRARDTAETGGWSAKDQHDAVIQRVGCALVAPSEDDDKSTLDEDLIGSLLTNLRVRYLVDHSMNDKDERKVRLIALWEDGTIRTLTRAIPRGVKNDVYVRDTVENRGLWDLAWVRDPETGHPAVLTHINASAGPCRRRIDYPPKAGAFNIVPPPIKAMVPVGFSSGFVCLDAVGGLWLTVEYESQLLLASIAADPRIGPIRHIAPIDNVAAFVKGEPFIHDGGAAIMAVNEEGVEYVGILMNNMADGMGTLVQLRANSCKIQRGCTVIKSLHFTPVSPDMSRNIHVLRGTGIRPLPEGANQSTIALLYPVPYGVLTRYSTLEDYVPQAGGLAELEELEEIEELLEKAKVVVASMVLEPSTYNTGTADEPITASTFPLTGEEHATRSQVQAIMSRLPTDIVHGEAIPCLPRWGLWRMEDSEQPYLQLTECMDPGADWMIRAYRMSGGKVLVAAVDYGKGMTWFTEVPGLVYLPESDKCVEDVAYYQVRPVSGRVVAGVGVW